MHLLQRHRRPQPSRRARSKLRVPKGGADVVRAVATPKSRIQDNSRTNLQSTTRRTCCKETTLGELASSKLDREGEGIRAKDRGAAELTGGTLRGSSQPPEDCAPGDVATASSSATSTPLAGDDAVADSPRLGSFRFFFAGSTTSSSSSTSSRGECAEGISSSSSSSSTNFDSSSGPFSGRGG